MEENKVVVSEEEQKEAQKGIHMSTVRKARKNLAYLQKKKDKGEKIVQMCPAALGPMFALAAEVADCDILRTPSWFADTQQDSIDSAIPTIKSYRAVAQRLHINFYMPTPTYASKEKALSYGSEYVVAGADSMLPMGISNETLRYMTDNYVPVYGHIGAISGWQTNATGYSKLGKTAEDALRVFKMGYEYQENGMGGMTVELTPIEVSAAIAKKLRVPVVSIAGGAACDGSEMVDMDTFGMMPSAASHAKTYANFMEFAATAYAMWANDVRTGAYPEDKHGWHMDPEELDKFMNALEKF
ncbi:hypothetical protein C3B58_09460 [Lactonifactor longoviformis]|uniref:3-methyl-2-oxobutanoate hydroxymethyltransferase n=1 Tax=Lactonifactor longoviformis DSM 17459 TaxID=1122155 RepID=A0A1M4SVA2_9CLOT|nr:3-methyl-2-oxobutanoate hydroxymethyltransferase [Lactonifactor longoviformis]POP33012.1 hypothetical protein C3B58_09460 [Lactonifactor longoviformis]SHE36135.1 3-methyl-2-oxobutanoate hydroxymethyltransferase [Lactonifactor longoviformis DSM 17459]